MNGKAKCPGWRSNWVYGNGEPDPDPSPPDHTCAGCKHLTTEDGKDSCGLKKELEEKVVRLQKEIAATKEQIEGLKWEETKWKKTQRELEELIKKKGRVNMGQDAEERTAEVDLGMTLAKMMNYLMEKQALRRGMKCGIALTVLGLLLLQFTVYGAVLLIAGIIIFLGNARLKSRAWRC